MALAHDRVRIVKAQMLDITKGLPQVVDEQLRHQNGSVDICSKSFLLSTAQPKYFTNFPSREGSSNVNAARKLRYLLLDKLQTKLQARKERKKEEELAQFVGAERRFLASPLVDESLAARLSSNESAARDEVVSFGGVASEKISVHEGTLDGPLESESVVVTRNPVYSIRSHEQDVWQAVMRDMADHVTECNNSVCSDLDEEPFLADNLIMTQEDMAADINAVKFDSLSSSNGSTRISSSWSLSHDSTASTIDSHVACKIASKKGKSAAAKNSGTKSAGTMKVDCHSPRKREYTGFRSGSGSESHNSSHFDGESVRCDTVKNEEPVSKDRSVYIAGRVPAPGFLWRTCDPRDCGSPDMLLNNSKGHSAVNEKGCMGPYFPPEHVFFDEEPTFLRQNKLTLFPESNACSVVSVNFSSDSSFLIKSLLPAVITAYKYGFKAVSIPPLPSPALDLKDVGNGPRTLELRFNRGSFIPALQDAAIRSRIMRELYLERRHRRQRKYALKHWRTFEPLAEELTGNRICDVRGTLSNKDEMCSVVSYPFEEDIFKEDFLVSSNPGNSEMLPVDPTVIVTALTDLCNDVYNCCAFWLGQSSLKPHTSKCNEGIHTRKRREWWDRIK